MRLAYLAAIAIFGAPLGVQAQNANAVDATAISQGNGQPNDDFTVVASLRAAAKSRDTAGIQGLLNAAPDARMKVGQSVAAVRRAAAACGWLCNEGRYGDAMVLARTTIAALAAKREVGKADQAERLYWEAWLNAQILGDRATALSLLNAAAVADPQDKRIQRYTERIAQALETFGQ